MKKVFIAAAALLVFFIPARAYAAYTDIRPAQTDIQLSLPGNWLYIDRDVKRDDILLRQNGETREEFLAYAYDNDLYLEAWREDFTGYFSLFCYPNDKMYFYSDWTDLSQQQQQNILQNLLLTLSEEDYLNYAANEIIESGGQTFIALDFADSRQYCYRAVYTVRDDMMYFLYFADSRSLPLRREGWNSVINSVDFNPLPPVSKFIFPAVLSLISVLIAARIFRRDRRRADYYAAAVDMVQREMSGQK